MLVGAERPAATWELIEGAGVAVVLTWCGDAQRAQRIVGVGIDNIEMSAHIFPSLTSVHLPVARIGEAAASCLLDELAGKGVKSPLELPIELVPRKSSAKLI